MSQVKTPLALIVDDDPLETRIIASALRKFGVKSEVFTNSRDFLNRLKDSTPDLCLVDLNIEGLGTGYTIVQAVRNILGDGPKLIVISGNSDRVAIAHALELGANDYIVKPIVLESFGAKLSRYVMTEQLLDAKPAMNDVPEDEREAFIDIELKISSLDEAGVKLTGTHLLAKGAQLELSGKFIFELLGTETPLDVTVISNSVEADGSFSAFAEFSEKSAELTAALARKLATSTGD